ncbi:DUF2461 domain-containing protein [Spirosoma montaniterrae]|uniref:TIGR02453 family protein n=1 Tax=Spirosoma montaniterrae TaxID=1178516 RepID=A0A1P9WWC7_9BACT|nr:DUF2461 domain-containing protein [Spirosoma montaniterrae]AQG79679.1 hypothetical protein AWR27_10270 [Spirosoma montaniterrae]
MLQPTTLRFLTDLKANNEKPWFDANRRTYEAARADVVQLTTTLIDGLNASDPDIAGASLQPKKCIFRINRDVRFSANKSPYKTNFGAWFSKGSKHVNAAGYYLNIEPGGSFVAGGLYMPDAPLLAAIRQEIDYTVDEFNQILTAPTFTAYYDGLNRDDVLQRPPKGYAADNPAIEYLKLKSFTAWHRLPDDALTQPNLAQHVLAAFAALQPLVTYLNRAVS